MTRLCLVRHGQTTWNLEGRYQGQSDVPLNEIGRAQARYVAEQLQSEQFSAIYSSDLKRAKETADIIGECLHLPITLEPRLREINQGEWEGQLVDAIKGRYTRLWHERFIDPVNIRPPGGETLGEVATRVCTALDSIVRLHTDSPVVIVSHGLSLATAICKVRGVPIGHAYSMMPDNTEPVWIDWAS
jgi:broad specificity phosphatase PhoE